jgi:hypothetical protein
VWWGWQVAKALAMRGAASAGHLLDTWIQTVLSSGGSARARAAAVAGANLLLADDAVGLSAEDSATVRVRTPTTTHTRA